jgi:integrase
MVSLTYYHALRVTELVKLPWDAIDLDGGTISVRRQKARCERPAEAGAG